jgi:hypothetical protein
MVDRTDIDALLIGALYGELTPAEEARLMARLESHPADRTALHDLTRTRAAVRDSRILAFQLEPPQAISALLLQEAARRAPRAVTDRGEAATWFQRFVRSFMAHPAMAAAATLVLVITAAGTLYLRGTDQLARSEAPPSAVERVPTSAITTGAAASSLAPAAPAPEPVAAPEESAPGQRGASAGAPAGSSGEGAAGSAASRFDGAPAAASDATVQDPGAAREAAFEADRVQDPGRLSARAQSEKAKASGQGFTQDSKLRKLDAATRPAPARAAKAEAMHGIELRTPQLQPKDLADDEKPTAGRRGGAGEVARDQRNAAVAGGGAPATPPGSAPPPPPAPANAPGASRAAGPAGAVDFDVSQTQQAPAAHEAKRPAAKPSANQQQPAPSAGNAVNAQTDRRLGKTANAANTENTVSGDTRQEQADRLLEWARKQREQVIAYVNANRCREAATAAVEIYNRAPDYYSANVATDRLVKPCLPYVTGARERADRSRASNKNAADVQAPAQAAPSRK